MSEEIVSAEEKKAVEVPQSLDSRSDSTKSFKSRGGFMGGGALSTFMFLIAFFLVSYSLGYTTSQYNKVIAGVLPNSAANPQASGQGSQAAAGLQDGATITKKVDIDERRVKGNKNAKVTIIEFSDFQCPFCGRFYTDTYGQLLKKYVDTGKVRIAFKDFPLSFHPQAQKAAEASRCALEQNKFWEMHDKLFENQATLSVDNFKKWAVDLGMKSDQFNSCLDSGKYANDIKKDVDEGLGLGIQGTPSFLINGQALVGAYPVADFEKVIDEKLK